VSDDTPFLKIASQWLVAAFLVSVLIILFVFIAAVQITSETAGLPILRRAVAVTTNIDATLPELEAGLHVAAKDSTVENVRLPGFPIPVEIPRAEAGELGGAELRNRILDQSAGLLYDDGMSVWDDSDPEGSQRIDRVSTAGGIHRGFGLIRDSWHIFFIVLAALFGALALLIAAVLLLTLTPPMRLVVLGAVLAVSGVLSLAAAVAVRFALRTAQTEADPFEDGLLGLGVDTVWIMIRNCLILSVLGVSILAVSSLALHWQSRAGRQSAPSTDANL